MKYLKKVRFRTPESVELEYSLAGLGNRTFALVIDYTLWVLVLVLLGIFGTLFATEITEALGSTLGTENLELWLSALFFLSLFVVYVGYFSFFETIWRGQTPGKRVANIRVLREDGGTVGLLQAVLRGLLRPIDDVLFLGFFLILLTDSEKRLGDWAAGTIVVQEIGDTAKRETDIALGATAESAATWLEEKTKISAINPDDLVLLREFLQRRNLMKSAVKIDVATKLAECLRPIVGLPKLPKGMTVEMFLEGLFIAYQRQNAYKQTATSR